jgi:hypothetical protein
LSATYVGSFKSLNKYAQNIKTFICDFVGSVKLCQTDLHNMYYDEKNKYNYNDFPQFQNFIDHNSDHLHTIWWNNPIVGVQQATFYYYGKLYNIHNTCKLTSVHNIVIQEAWAQFVQEVKTECTRATLQLINELDKRFPA